ncbi:uncharacterized protein LOC119109158 [Pollicipes pollicipes]|uniref:uncharacterized protein LOC119109158 n=1 Tax=Pollicipes pollicipes TaxID=41117 RepID=UPI0018851E7E|nr:uncharacterized protein LOC119109158 [Pollicipes pollicipes]
MARPRVKSLDDLIVNVATINIGDEAADEDLFTDEEEAQHEGVIVIVDQLEGGAGAMEAAASPPADADQGADKGARAKPPLVRKSSSQRRIQQIRIRGKTVWEARLTDPARAGEPDQALGLGVFIASDAARQHLVYKVDSLVSSVQLQLRARDRLLEVNGTPVVGWTQPALASFFLSIPLAPTRTPHDRSAPRGSFWQPFSMLVERTPRPASKADPRVPFSRLLRAHLSYQASRKQVVFSDVTARVATDIQLTFKSQRMMRIRHVASASWLAVTSLLAGRSRLCTRENEGDATVFRVHEYRTADPYAVPVCMLQTPGGEFVSCCGNPAPAVSKGAWPGVGDEVTVCDARCLLSRSAGPDGAVTLETIKAGHQAEYLCLEGRTLLFRPEAPGLEPVFCWREVPGAKE